MASTTEPPFAPAPPHRREMEKYSDGDMEAAMQEPEDPADRDGPQRFRAVKGSNLDRLRAYNLSAVLTSLHHDGPRSRSGLATATGLNRSTVTILVNELIDLGLAVEPVRSADDGAKKSVGRPSVDVDVSDHVFAIAVAPEVDAIRVGVVGLGGRVRKIIHYDTGSVLTMRETVSIASVIIQGILTMLPENASVVGVGVAVPGLTNDEDGSVSLAPQLGWRSEPLASELRDATGLPVRAANDAHLGLLAEISFGGSSHAGSAIYLNGGANRIGGGIMSGGHLLKGSSGYAGELGHFRIRSGGDRDSAGLQGTLESEVNRDALVDSLGLDRRDFHRLDEELARRRSPRTQAEVNRQIDALGTALGTMVTIFNPDLIILGGFLGSLLDAEPVRLRNVIARESLAPQLSAVRIVRPTLGAENLLIGAAELAFQPLLSDPGNADWLVRASEAEADAGEHIAETR